MIEVLLFIVLFFVIVAFIIILMGMDGYKGYAKYIDQTWKIEEQAREIEKLKASMTDEAWKRYMLLDRHPTEGWFYYEEKLVPEPLDKRLQNEYNNTVLTNEGFTPWQRGVKPKKRKN